MRTHIFNVSAILSADNIKIQMSFFLILFFLPSLNWEKEYVIAILWKSVGRNSLNVYLAFFFFLAGSFWEYFLFYGLAGFYIARLECVCHLVQELSSSSPGVLATVFTHLVTPTAVLKLIFFIPISADGKRCYFRFRVLANHLASFFFFPLSGDSLGLLSLSPGRGYGVQIAWPAFFSSFDGRPKLTCIPYSSFNGQSLAAC